MPTSEQITNFVQATFRSVWALELLLLLRANHGRAMTHVEMVEALRGSDLVVMRSMESLTAAGLVVPDAQGAVRFSPATEQLQALVDGTASLYASSPDLVRRMIVSAANSGAAAFADAFRLRKD